MVGLLEMLYSVVVNTAVSYVAVYFEAFGVYWMPSFLLNVELADNFDCGRG